MTGGAPVPARPLLPGLVGAVAALVTAVAAFLPWYAPDLGPPLTPDSVSGWEATAAAKIAVVACVVHVLAALVLVADSRDLVALDASGATALAGVAVLASVVAVAAVGFRTLRVPEPAAVLAREPGLYLALAAAAAALLGALAQLTVTADPGGLPSLGRGRRRR